MKRACRFVLCLAMPLGLAATGVAQPTFDLGLTGPLSVSGPASSTVQIDYTARLTTNGLTGADPGAQGWSVSLSADGWAITSATTAGTIVDTLVDGGFTITELTTKGGGACAGRNGVVSGVVLSFRNPVTLPPTGAADILKLTAEGTAPASPDDPCARCRIFYVNGCQGSGQPVDNKVTYVGQTELPTLGQLTTDVCAQRDCTPEDLNVIMQATNIAAAPHQSANLYENMIGSDVDVDGSLAVTAAPGTKGQATVYAGIVSQLPGGGAQGWSLSLRVAGDLTLLSGTTAGGAGAPTPDGLQKGGFESTEIIDPNRPFDPPDPEAPNPQGQGIVAAVVLSFRLPITLLPTGTATVLGISVESALDQGDDPIRGSIKWRDNLVGSGQPVANVATVEGGTLSYCACQGVNISFEPTRLGRFVRGNANDDFKDDIADAVWIVNELFRPGSPATTCKDAADANNSGNVDSSDAVYLLAYQFGTGEPPVAGPAPPDPFPACGTDPEGDDDGLDCAQTQARCN